MMASAATRETGLGDEMVPLSGIVEIWPPCL
jgi:hypothetical protein